MLSITTAALTLVPAAGWGLGAWVRNSICNLAPYWC